MLEKDKYNLSRFIEAQSEVYPIALQELQDGSLSHRIVSALNIIRIMVMSALMSVSPT